MYFNMFAWSRTTYAKWHNIIFNFEWKRDLDYFLAHAEGSERISAVDAWKTEQDFVRVYASCTTGSSRDRKERIKKWYEDKRHNV